jgi:hypothetical protein
MCPCVSFFTDGTRGSIPHLCAQSIQIHNGQISPAPPHRPYQTHHTTAPSQPPPPPINLKIKKQSIQYHTSGRRSCSRPTNPPPTHTRLLLFLTDLLSHKQTKKQTNKQTNKQRNKQTNDQPTNQPINHSRVFAEEGAAADQHRLGRRGGRQREAPARAHVDHHPALRHCRGWEAGCVFCGWGDGWMDGWMWGGREGWMDGWMDVYVCVCLSVCRALLAHHPQGMVSL